MSTTIFTYGGKVLKNSDTNKWLIKAVPPPLPPIPSYSIRAKIREGVEPGDGVQGPPFTYTLVDAAQNIWDITHEGGQYFSIIPGFALINAVEVLDWNPGDLTTLSGGTGFGGNSANPYLKKVTLTNFGNLTSVNGSVGNLFTNMSGSLDALEEINISGTNNISNFRNFCLNCTGLKVIHDFEVSSATDVYSMFNGCTNVESGALSMYTKLSALGEQITDHSYAFANCGSNTVTGAAELAQIPSSWGGTGA